MRRISLYFVMLGISIMLAACDGGDTKEVKTEGKSEPQKVIDKSVGQDNATPEAIIPKSTKGLSTKLCEWYTNRNTDHTPMRSAAQVETFDEMGGYYINKDLKENEKVIYLTFDCGYELGYTDAILDTLKKHNAPAMFFVTYSYIRDEPELAKRMKKEGHLVGNHTRTHPSLALCSEEKIKKELKETEDYFKETTGYQMDKYVRPPQGEYSQLSLQVAQNMGYKSVFWSLAYPDWDPNNQPGKAKVLEMYEKYHHPGAIPLLHNVSSSNTEALDEVLTYLKSEGYRFGSLEELK